MKVEAGAFMNFWVGLRGEGEELVLQALHTIPLFHFIG